MSTTYFTWTFPSESFRKADSLAFEDLWADMSSPVAVGHILPSASRNDWLTGFLSRAASHFEVCTIGFVSDLEGGTVRRDGGGHAWTISTLDCTAVNSARRGVEQLLKLASDNFDQIARLIDNGYDAERVRREFELSRADYDPIKGPCGDEEGDGPMYFFSYLKCLLSLLGHAQAHGLCVIHIRPTP